MAELAQPPLYIVEEQKSALLGKSFVATKAYTFWLQSLTQALSQATTVPQEVPPLTNVGGAVSPTAIYEVTTAGLYRVSYLLRITTPAATSSSVTVIIGYTDTGIAITQQGPPLTGNTTTSVQSGSFLCHAEASTPIVVATNYASNPAGQMQYSLQMTVESVG